MKYVICALKINNCLIATILEVTSLNSQWIVFINILENI